MQYVIFQSLVPSGMVCVYAVTSEPGRVCFQGGWCLDHADTPDMQRDIIYCM